ncbi:MAG: T9SS type A sorting domain-containing protein [Candidatus Eisenbacteria bacterium]|nr:T9SS type A sorting domain-containing protein [Candidatus Eisenbacteria bacterium]
MPRGPRMALEPPTERAGKETRTALFPPAPNPATDGARISFTLAAPCRANLSIYDCAGRKVATVLDRSLGAGRHTADYTRGLRGLSSGLYFVRLEAGEDAATSKIVVAR